MENELRKDYFLDRWVIVSAGRGKRPTDYVGSPVTGEDSGGTCFFCPGSEDSTPPEVSRVEVDGEWVVRVFPNKFPAVTEEEGCDGGENLMAAHGRHEIVVESPVHGETLADLDVQRIAEVIRVYGERVTSMCKDPKVKYALVFKNHGRVAGASLAHTHTQIVSLPLVPKLVKEEVNASEQYVQINSSCPFCDALEAEENGPRWIFGDENAAAFTPYASRSPFEAWVMPRKHVRDFNEVGEELADSVAKALKAVVSALKHGLNDCPYNMYFHVAPFGEDLHMHVEVLPRLSVWAGFELGSETVINTMVPEEAAEFYRQKQLI